MPHNLPKRSSKKFVVNWKKSFEANRSLSTALLFNGPEGSGRHEAATEIAQTLLGPLENHPDYVLIGPEKKTIKIDAIRKLIRQLSFKSFQGNYRLVLVDEAEKMTIGAANALLKTLEEPPPSVLFILLTTTPDKLPLTIRSRCQTVLFQVSHEQLQEKFASLIGEWQEEIFPFFKSPSFTNASGLAEVIAQKPDRFSALFEFLRGLWCDLILYRETNEEKDLYMPSALSFVRNQVERRDRSQVFEEIDLINETERALDGNVNKTLALERLFVKLGS